MLVEEKTDEPQVPPEEDQTGFIEGVERTPEVDEQLREFGIEPEEEKKDETPEPEKPEAVEPQVPFKEESPAPVEEKATEEEIEITEEAAQKLIEDQTGKSKQDDEQYPWEKENREPTQREVLDYVADRTIKLQEERKTEAERVKTEQQNQNLQAYQKQWKGNLDFLESNNYIPKVSNKDDKNDLGLVARTKLFEQAVLHNELDLEKVYWRYVKPNEGKQPPGADAPIARGANADTEKSQDDDEFFYDEIHNKDPERDFDTVELDK